MLELKLVLQETLKLSLQLAPKLNMVNSRTLPIVSISQVTSTNTLITFSVQEGVTS